MNRNWTKIDAADELRRIGPQIGAAIRELDRLCERLPQEMVNRIEEAAPEIVHLDHLTGPKLSVLAKDLQAEIDTMPDDEHEAMMQQVEARRKAERVRLRSEPADRTIPFARGSALKMGTPPTLMAGDGPDEAA